MQNLNLISVIVPCYNQAAFLDECVQSLLAQTWQNWECIIINDGSTDHTADRACHWQRTDSRIRYIEKPNGGLSSARNAGLKHALGNYIQFLDSDDFLATNKFEISMRYADGDNIVITDFYRFDHVKQKTLPPHCILHPKHFTLEQFVLNWDHEFSVPIHCALFPRKAINSVQFIEELRAKEDWAFWLQVFSAHPLVCFVPEPLVYYRMSSAGMTNDEELMSANRLAFVRKIDGIINDPLLLQSFYQKNLIAALEEKMALQKRIRYMEFKRTLNYKFKKVLKMAGFKVRISLHDFTG